MFLGDRNTHIEFVTNYLVNSLGGLIATCLILFEYLVFEKLYLYLPSIVWNHIGINMTI